MRHQLCVLVLVFTSCQYVLCATAKSVRPLPVAVTEVWVAQTITGMSLEEKVGQMFQIRVYGDYASSTSSDFLALREQIKTYHIGSLDLGGRMQGPNLVKGAPERVADILNQLQKDSKLPLLVGADVERGLASRLSQVPEWLSARSPSCPW